MSRRTDKMWKAASRVTALKGAPLPTNCVKLALRRDESYPAGVSAPMHCVCTCGHDIKVQDATNRCTWCGLVVAASGWILEEGKR